MAKLQHQNTAALLESLRAEGIETWFDLGLLLDRLRDRREVPSARAPAEKRAFEKRLSEGVAFVTYGYTVDGVTMEILKYATALKRVLPNPEIHFIGGHIDPRTAHLFPPLAKCHEIPPLSGFGACPLYRPFFHKRLERGSPLYNRLIKDLWSTTLELVEELGLLFEEEKIRIVFAVNTNSNPGNPALALALVLLSEHFGLPVISNNHDFYWEGGNSEIEREVLGIAKGPRDHFFTNSHLGEVFSILEMTYPWEGRTWFSLNLNHHQSDMLVETFGHNPANVAEVGTAVDGDAFGILALPRRREVLSQLAFLLGGDAEGVPVQDIGRVADSGALAEAPQHATLLGRGGDRSIEFGRDNLILLQPTRIIARKHIERNFDLVGGLLQDPDFIAALEATPTLKLTLVVTGPIANGQSKYWIRLLQIAREKLESLPEHLRERVYFAPLFAGIDDEDFNDRFDAPATIGDLYGVSSLICLPSETEGRGLPIIEAAACGVPALVRRYAPEEVYAHVIGEHLAQENRLRVVEFQGNRISKDAIDQAGGLLLNPQSRDENIQHNRAVAADRYSMNALTRDLEVALHRLRNQLQTNRRPREKAASALAYFRRAMRSATRRASDFFDSRNREYLPGHGRLGFMLMLKSLIDPSAFREEEQRIRGMAFSFARRLVESGHEPTPPSVKAQRDFYDAVDSLFIQHLAEMPIMFDHALAYRHRNRIHFPYRDLTLQELEGAINWLHHECSTPEAPQIAPVPAHPITSWHGAVEQLCGPSIAIDQRERLHAMLAQDRAFAFFPGTSLERELEVFVLYAVRHRLGLLEHEPLERHHLDEWKSAPIYLMVRRSPCANAPTTLTVKQFVTDTPNEELRLIFKSRVCRIVSTRQLSPGIDVRQLGKKGLTALREVESRGGFLLAAEEQAAVTTDILNLDRFHVGRAGDPFEANLLGIDRGAGYVQWVPAGLRFCLAYPTPIQTGKSLAELLEGDAYAEACDRLGEKAVLESLRQDAAERGSPVERQLQAMLTPLDTNSGGVVERSIGGLYDDGQPWSGNLATVKSPLRYRIVASDSGPQTVLELTRRFEEQTGEQPRIAWNGGYILNAELVGKLGLPESYIGSPLGLIIADGRVVSPPLYDKPAILVDESGALSIRRVSCAGGLRVEIGATTIDMAASAYNPVEGANGEMPEVAYYDLLHSDDELPGNGRTLVRLAGNRVMDICTTRSGENLAVFPVGLVLSFAAGPLPPGLEVGRELELDVKSLVGIQHGVEAGPLLVDEGEVCIDMVAEGWTTQNSIRTQAARLDYLDMRGPKIAAGLDASGQLTVLTINGRIRESVGATHVDMAEILQSQGLKTAMGFDPGGSSTLVVAGETVNISPYNRDYERNIYALPPQPRAVSNIVLGHHAEDAGESPRRRR